MQRQLHNMLLLCLAGMCSAAFAGVGVNKSTGGMESLKAGSKEIKLAAEAGGFSAYDAVSKKNIEFADGSIKEANDKTVFSCEKKGELGLTAEFVDKGKYILVTGQVENLKGGERGIALNYCLPFTGKDIVFGNELNTSVKVSEVEKEGNEYPVAALCSADTGLAMAIPPSDPREFGMVGSSKGLTVRFYLGISPVTKNFPNRAPFSFIIYTVEPAWGFRSALSKYYSFFPDYYTVRTKKDGLLILAMDGNVPPNIDQYGFDRSAMGEGKMKEELARDKKYGILTLPSNNVGVRELTKLPSAPADYNDALQVYKKFCADACSPELCEEIATSTCQQPDGNYEMLIRTTFWGGGTISFKTNPNPDLFADIGKHTVGSDNLALMLKRIEKYPQLDGMFLDSLGRVWPGLLNYRKDHFTYARYPLTIDPNGRIALHNQISHYEFAESLRKKMREQGRYIWANGIYAYDTIFPGTKYPDQYPKYPEHYRTNTRLGRFFICSLLDIACCEVPADTSMEGVWPWWESWEWWEHGRVVMGKKPFGLLNYFWHDPNKVESYMNKSLCYAFFATNKTNPFTKEKYYGNPNGYEKYKKLTDWFVPLVRKLSQAGWEPVRYATVDSDKVLCERYGSGNTIYYTMYNDSESPVTCTLTVDLKGIGFSEGGAVYEEIAKKVKPEQVKPNQVKIQLKPRSTYIIQLTKLWMWG